MPPLHSPPSVTDTEASRSSHRLLARMGSVTRRLTWLSDSNATSSTYTGPGRPLGVLLDVAGRRLEALVDRAVPLAGLGFEGIARRLLMKLRAPHARCRAWPDFVTTPIVELAIQLGSGNCNECHRRYMSTLGDMRRSEIERFLFRLIPSIDDNLHRNCTTGSMLLAALALSDDIVLAALRDLQLVRRIKQSSESRMLLAMQDDNWKLAWDSMRGLEKILESSLPVDHFLSLPYSDEQVLEIWNDIGSSVSVLRGMLRIFPSMSSLIVARLDSTIAAGQSLIQQLSESSTQAHLNALYTHVLSILRGSDNARSAGKVLGTMAILQESTTPALLATLLDLSPQEVLTHLQAFIDVRLLTTDNALGPITDATAFYVCHNSLRDFVMDPLRCGVKHFLVNPVKTHKKLLGQCLRLLDEHLCEDICGIRDPGLANAEIPDLPARLDRHVPEALRYACRCWPIHLVNSGSVFRAMPSEVLSFCTHHLLHWLEVLSLLGELSYAGEYLPQITARYQAHELGSTVTLDVVLLLRQAYHVVQAYAAPISSHALQVYHSVLATGPDCRLLYYVRSSEIVVPLLASQRASDWGPALHIMQGHTSGVNSVACSLDGSYVFSGSDDSTVIVWNTRTGRQLTTLEDHGISMHSVAASPDGDRMATASGDNTVQMYDMPSGTAVFTLKGHGGLVWSVAFSFDGKYIASGSDDKTVRVWDVRTGRQLALLEGHKDWVGSVAFSLDGAHIVSGSGDHTVRIWDAQTGRPIAVCEGHSSSVWSIAVSRDEARFASGSDDTTIRFWNAQAGKQLALLEGHSDCVRSVAFSPDGMLLVSGSDDKTVRVWDARGGEQLSVFKGHSGWVRSVAVSPDGAYIFSGSDDKTIRVWKLQASEQVAVFDGHSAWVRSLAFSPDGAYIVSGSEDKTVRVWEAKTGKQLIILEGHRGWVRCVAFSADGGHIASGSDDKTVRVWNAQTGKQLAVLAGHYDSVLSVAFSPDGAYVVSCSDDETLRIWDAYKSKQLAMLEGHSGHLLSVTFLADGKHIVSSIHGGPDLAWKIKNVRGVISLDRLNSSIAGLTFAPAEPIVWNEETGWISWQRSDRISPVRLCWLPVERRGPSFASHNTTIAIGAQQGTLTILNFSDVLAMLKGLK